MSSMRFSCGHRLLRLEDAARSRPVLIDLWYPADPSLVEVDHVYGLGSGRVVPDAPSAEGSGPAIVLSHGAFGSAGSYAWIAEHLARVGYVVCGVSHFGESPVYGLDTIDPLAVMDLGARAVDCSFALDRLLAASTGVRVDASRVGALGHSSGGATVIALLGGVFDANAMARYCASDEAHADRGCDYARGSAPTAPLPEPRPVADPRVRVAVAMDPALGPGFLEDSLASIAIPVHVIGAMDNDFLPVEAHASRYARLIPRCAFTPLADGEGHFVYLNECSSDLEANGVPLCRDRDGVDRATVHRRLAPIVQRTFESVLGN